MQSDYIATLIVTTVGVADSSVLAFVGESERTPKEYEVRCLYEKNISPTERERYGFSSGVSGVLYIAPDSLVQLFGTFRLDRFKTQVRFFGSLQNVESVNYQEEFAGTCVAVVVGLRSATKAG